MKKAFLLVLGICIIGMVGCQQEKQEKQTNNTVTLTQYEKDLAQNDSNIGAQLLVRKAVLEDMKKQNMSDKEKLELEFAKDNAAITYYLEKKLNDIKITEDEVKKVYEENKDKLEGKTFDEVHNELKNLIKNYKKNQELIGYYNGLVEKYKLNDSLKKEFPEKATTDTEKKTKD